MKLLVPRERISLEQQERERLVKEETALSSQVDELRELKQTEAKRLQDFQEREYNKHLAEVERRNNVLTDLDKVIEGKKKEVEAFFGPLDKQWALFKQVEKAKIETEQARQAQTATDLFLREQELDIKDAEQAKKDMSLRQKHSEILALSDSVKKDKERAVKEAADVRQKAADLYNEAEVAKNNAKSLESQAQIALREVQIKQEALDQREKELENRETQVLIKELTYYSPIAKTIHGIPDSERSRLA